MNMSSSSDLDDAHSAMAARVRIIPDIGAAGTGWIPRNEDSNPWIRVQMDSIHSVRAVVTQGCGDQDSWVTEYCISFKDESNETAFYQGTTLNDCKVCHQSCIFQNIFT